MEPLYYGHPQNLASLWGGGGGGGGGVLFFYYRGGVFQGDLIRGIPIHSTFLQVSYLTSLGRNRRHGGHQLAEKYSCRETPVEIGQLSETEALLVAKTRSCEGID